MCCEFDVDSAKWKSSTGYNMVVGNSIHGRSRLSSLQISTFPFLATDLDESMVLL